MAPCQVEVKIEGQIALVILSGTLVHEDVVLVSTEVARNLDQGYKRIIIDMSKLVHVSSKGLGALISAQRQIAESNAQLILLNPQPKAQELFRLTKLDTVFRIHYGTPDEAEALFRVVVKK